MLDPVRFAQPGDRARLAGSLALSTPEIRAAYLNRAPEHEALVLRRRIYAFGPADWCLWPRGLVAVFDPLREMAVISALTARWPP